MVVFKRSILFASIFGLLSCDSSVWSNEPSSAETADEAVNTCKGVIMRSLALLLTLLSGMAVSCSEPRFLNGVSGVERASSKTEWPKSGHAPRHRDPDNVNEKLEGTWQACVPEPHVNTIHNNYKYDPVNTIHKNYSQLTTLVFEDKKLKVEISRFTSLDCQSKKNIVETWLSSYEVDGNKLKVFNKEGKEVLNKECSAYISFFKFKQGKLHLHNEGWDERAFSKSSVEGTLNDFTDWDQQLLVPKVGSLQVDFLGLDRNHLYHRYVAVKLTPEQAPGHGASVAMNSDVDKFLTENLAVGTYLLNAQYRSEDGSFQKDDSEKVLITEGEKKIVTVNFELSATKSQPLWGSNSPRAQFKFKEVCDE
jgi:hypothetical protein